LFVGDDQRTRVKNFTDNGKSVLRNTNVTIMQQSVSVVDDTAPVNSNRLCEEIAYIRACYAAFYSLAVAACTHQYLGEAKYRFLIFGKKRMQPCSFLGIYMYKSSI
jgi:hypothetical protein